MSVLDSFVFLLKADSKDAVQAIEQTGRGFDDLRDDAKKTEREVDRQMDRLAKSVAEAMNQSTDKVKDFSHTLGTDMIGAVKGAIAGAAGLASIGEILSVIGEQFEKLQGLTGKAKFLGVDPAVLDVLHRGFGQMGVEADALDDSITDLNEAMGEVFADPKSGKAQALKALGISMRDSNGDLKTGADLLSDLNKAANSMDASKFTFYAKQLGVTDNAVLSALSTSRDKTRQIFNDVIAQGMITPKQLDDIRLMNEEQTKLNNTITDFKRKLAVESAPFYVYLYQQLNKLTKYLEKHPQLLKGIAVGFAVAGAAALAFAAPVILSFMAISAAVAAVSVAFGLLYDYFTAADPDDTIIGGLIKDIPFLKDLLQGLKKGFQEFWDWLVLSFKDPEKAGEQLRSFLKKCWEQMKDDAKQVWAGIIQYVQGLFDNIGAEMAKSIAKSLNDMKTWANENLHTSFEVTGAKPATNSPGGPDMAVPGDTPQVNQQAATGDLSPDHPLAQATVPAAAASSAVGMAAVNSNLVPSTNAQMLSGRGGYTDNSSRQVHVDKIEVNSNSADPRQVAAAVPGALNDHLSNAAQHFDDGVSH